MRKTWKRREFLRATAAWSFLSTTSPWLSVALAKSQSSREYHQIIEDFVKKGWAQAGAKIHLLYPKGCLGNIQPIAKTFHEKTGVKVILKEAALDEITTQMILSTQLGGEHKFDVALPPTFGIPDLVESKAIYDITRFSKKHEPVQMQKGSLYTLGDYYQGRHYGYQTDGDAYVMFFKKSLLESKSEQKRYLEQTGERLQTPQTWDELDRQIRFFHRPKENLYGGSLFRNKNYVAWEFWMRFHAKGYFPVDKNMKPQINNDQGVKALEELITTSQFLEPGARANGLFENFRSYAKGNKFCNIGWGGTQKYLLGDKSKMKDDLLVAVPPGIKKNGEVIPIPFFNWGWNYVVSSRSPQKELAYLFSLYASTPIQSERAVSEASGYFDPFREEHYQSAKIKATYSEEFLKAHRESMKNSIPDFYLKGQGKYLDALKENVYRADQGKLKPKEALDLTAQQWNRITREMGRENQKKQWMFLRRSYPKKLRSVLT